MLPPRQGSLPHTRSTKRYTLRVVVPPPTLISVAFWCPSPICRCWCLFFLRLSPVAVPAAGPGAVPVAGAHDGVCGGICTCRQATAAAHLVGTSARVTAFEPPIAAAGTPPTTSAGSPRWGRWRGPLAAVAAGQAFSAGTCAVVFYGRW